MEFLEFTEEKTGTLVCLPLTQIRSISQRENVVFIETGVDVDGVSLGFYTNNNYDEIKSKLNDFIL